MKTVSMVVQEEGLQFQRVSGVTVPSLIPMAIVQRVTGMLKRALRSRLLCPSRFVASYRASSLQLTISSCSYASTAA